MRNLRLSAALAGLVAVYGLTTAPSTKASISDVEVTLGGSCQLSIPTTDTKFRPKATGARNESTTTGGFVICALQRSASSGLFNDIALLAYSLDGVARNLSCTAVAGTFGAPAGYESMYSTKTASISSTEGINQGVEWTAADFGGSNGDPITRSLTVSITCNLPPQTAINYIVGTVP